MGVLLAAGAAPRVAVRAGVGASAPCVGRDRAAWQTQAARRLRGGHVLRRASDGEDLGELGSEVDDWREFRARLVQQELREQQSDDPSAEVSPETSDALGSPAEGWAHATPVIEQGSLLLSAPGDHFAINQQYFHKTLIFIVEHTENFTRGVILNRPTAFSTSDLRGSIGFSMDASEGAPDTADGWNVWCGGDCQGLNARQDVFSGGVAYCCLHTLERLGNKSREIIKGAYSIDLDIAQQLVEAGEAEQYDFLLLVGYCGWAPGQLQGELDRGGTWELAAAERKLLLGRLRDDQAALNKRLQAAMEERLRPGASSAPHLTFKEVGDGIAEWERLYAALGPKFQAELQEESDSHTDKMLQRWVNRCLIPPKFQAVSGSDVPGAFTGASLQLPAGSILRGSATAWLLGKPSEDPELDTTSVNGLPGQYLHKAVLLLAREYDSCDKEPAMLVLLNGPQVGRVQTDAGGVFFGGPGGGSVGNGVFEIKGEVPYRFQGMAIFMPGSFEALLNVGALEVAKDVDVQDVLSQPRSERWAAAGGKITRLADAAEAELGDSQQQKWYRRFLDVDFPPED